jgi:PAS domain S-box-containing protein
MTTLELGSGLMQTLLAAAVDLLKGSGGALYLLDEHSSTLSLAKAQNLPIELVGSKLAAAESLAGQVVKTKQPRFVADYGCWPHRLKRLDAFHLTTVAGAPIRWREKVWGAIVVHSDADHPPVAEADLVYLVLLGHLAAVVLESAWRRNELESVLAAAFDAVIAQDPSGRVIEFNRKAEEIIGYQADEVIDRPLGLLFAGPDESRSVRDLLQASGGAPLVGRRATIRSRGGEAIPVYLSATYLYNGHGDNAGTVAFLQDVREKEKQARRIQELTAEVAAQETVNVALVLLSRWGHRAKNKIAGLHATLRVLDSTLPRVPKYIKYLKTMADTLDELRYPAQHLLSQAQQVLGETPAHIDICHLATEIALQICHDDTFPIHVVTPQVRADCCWVIGSQLLVETALEMVIQNAQEAMEESGRPGTLTLAIHPDKQGTTLSVRDTGGGIDPAILADFFKKPVPSKTGFGYGSFVGGLIVRAQHGEIWVHESDHRGTEIRLRLPHGPSEGG